MYFILWVGQNFGASLFSQNDSLKDFSSISYLFVTHTTQIVLYFSNLLNLPKVYNGEHSVEKCCIPKCNVANTNSVVSRAPVLIIEMKEELILWCFSLLLYTAVIVSLNFRFRRVS